MNWEVRTMRSVTSCFNSTLYRKNLSRFWPIWALYSVIWLFALPLNLLTTIQRGQNWALEDLTHSLDYFSRVSVGYSLNLGTVLAVIFGLLAAMAVFSYLDASRSACMMHALPLRREALFFTNYLSGLSFLLLPNAAIFGLTLAGEAVGTCLDLKALAIWLLVQSASCLFFYSFAVFCAMFTGHLLALPVFYGVLNCLAAIISALMDSVLYLFLYGYNGLSGTTQQAVAWLTPLEKLGGAVSWTQAADSGAYQLAQPAVVAVYAGVGVALSAAALLIYRARQMESAGDVVSVRVVRPIFKYGVAVCAGLSGVRRRPALPGAVHPLLGCSGLFSGGDAAAQVLPRLLRLAGLPGPAGAALRPVPVHPAGSHRLSGLRPRLRRGEPGDCGSGGQHLSQRRLRRERPDHRPGAGRPDHRPPPGHRSCPLQGG